MKISESEILKLKETFIDTNLYQRVKTQVIEGLSEEALGSNLPAENIHINLAIEKGVAMAFSRLESLVVPKAAKKSSIQPTQVTKRTKPTT